MSADAQQQPGPTRLRRLRDNVFLVVAEFMIAASLPFGIMLTVIGGLLENRLLQNVGLVMLAFIGFAMAIGLLWGIIAGFALPIEFIRTWHKRTLTERIILTPLVLLLALMMLILVATIIALIVI